MRRLLQYMSAYKKESVLGPLFKMLEASFELLVPLVVAAMIDDGIASGDRGLVLRLGLSWLLGVQMAMGFSGLCWAEMLSPFPCALAGLLFLRLWLRRERPLDF